MELIHTLESVMALQRFPYVCVGSHAFAMISAHVLHERCGYMCTIVYPLRPILKFRLPVALYGSAMLCIQLNYVVFSRQLFLLSVYASCYTLNMAFQSEQKGGNFQHTGEPKNEKRRGKGPNRGSKVKQTNKKRRPLWNQDWTWHGRNSKSKS